MKPAKNKACKLLASRKNLHWSNTEENTSPLELLAHKESDGMLRIYGAFPIQNLNQRDVQQEQPTSKKSKRK